ncbi:exocyst subunit [Saxophila tyrrhenica]|uniref:Exocyst complex component Sec8 n=1 Tax=Saxophila tyrrhenica TaxID=1690608 RepID=A0AAV9P531_9PEZI|nr:exocyst subunit [Saxophila tyrrhenica]
MAYPNGYTKGTTNGSYSSLRRHDFHDSSRDTSADEHSRSRPAPSYGRSYNNNSAQPDHVHGVSRLERSHNNRRSRDYAAEGGQGNQSWSASRSRSRPGGRYGAAGNQIEEVLKYIEQHWGFMASADCIPIKVALQLMDSSSLGLQDQLSQFSEAHTQLQNALKVIVNEHHQGFNSSIGTFHKIQAAIHASQTRVRTLRAGLVDAKRDLIGSAQRPELKALASSSVAYDSMLQTVSTIEQLQLVPDRLEAQIREKRYLGAVDNLIEALAMIRKPELEDIGALSELRVHLSNQEQILTDLLVEELHNHLYLKSPYCEERWKGHMRRAALASGSTTMDSEAATASIIESERAIYTFLSNYDGSKPMQEDATRNPEADTFYYIQLLIESLNKMSRLDLAADKIEERLPVELFKVLERTLGEIEQRHPQSMMKSGRRRQQLASGGVAAGPDAEQRATLEDLLTMLYAKFEAIAEGHRVLFDVTHAILKREIVPSSEATMLNRSFRELWKLLQSEIRSLLHDHLASSGSLGTKSRQQNHASANIFKNQPRDRNRKLFKLQDTLKPGKDGKANTDLSSERSDLEFILKASVPGLVNSDSDASSLNKRPGALSNFEDDDSPSAVADRSATGHKLLISPSIFNMGLLLPPSLTFLRHLKEIVPTQQTSGVVPSTLTSFLDDFLINVFYPQLDETLLDLCGRCMSDPDTFQPDPKWNEVAKKPIFKGARRFMSIMEDVCGLLGRLPHEQSFAHLVVGQMRAFYDVCYEWSKGLLQRVGGSGEEGDEGNGALKMRLAADLATEGDINAVVIELLTAKDDDKEKIVLAEKESALLLRMIKSRDLESTDLIQDRKALAALCTLQVSMKWLAARCKALRFISPYAVDTTNIQTGHTRRWTATTVPTLSSNANSTPLPTTPYLPLDTTTAHQFDAVTTSFTELSTLILRTLHIDLRLHLLSGVSAALNTTYALGQPYNDPDPAILTLSEDLGSYDAQLSAHLLPPQHAFLASNLHVTANTALVGLVSTVPALDTHGSGRMGLNILVLQQSLKLLQPFADLGKAAQFYELGAKGPEAVVKEGPKSEEGYETEDLKALIRLCYDEERDKGLGDREAVAMKLGGWPARKTSLKGRGGRRGMGSRTQSSAD